MWRATYDVTRQVIDDHGEKNAGLIFAGVAFYGLFAIFSGLAATISLCGLLADPTVVASQLELMRGLMPPSVFRLFEIQIDGLLNAGSAMLGFTTLISIGLALWSARAGGAALIRGLKPFLIGPGMQADVEWHTGSKTVLQYLTKPLYRSQEALREP